MEIVCNFVGVNSYIISLDVIEIQVQLVICCLVCETYLLSNQGSYQLNKRQASAHNILPEPWLRFMERKRRSAFKRSNRQWLIALQIIQGMTSFMNSTRYRLFEIGPFIPSSYSYVVEAHSLSERMSRYIHSETFHVVLQESQNVMIELVNFLDIILWFSKFALFTKRAAWIYEFFQNLLNTRSQRTEYFIQIIYCKLFFELIQKRIIRMLFITYLLSDLLLYFYHLLQVGCIHHENRFFSRLPPCHVAPYSFQRFCFSQLFGYLDLLSYFPVEYSYNSLL